MLQRLTFTGVLVKIFVSILEPFHEAEVVLNFTLHFPLIFSGQSAWINKKMW